MNESLLARRLGVIFLMAIALLAAGALAPTVGQAASSILRVLVTDSNSSPVPVNVRNVVVGSQNRAPWGIIPPNGHFWVHAFRTATAGGATASVNLSGNS